MVPLVLLIARRVLLCLGHSALALSYSGVLAPWAERWASAMGSATLMLAEALDVATQFWGE